MTPREKDEDDRRDHLKLLSLTSLFNEFGGLEILPFFLQKPLRIIRGRGCVLGAQHGEDDLVGL